ncbi:hypothetical protein [Gordonia sp. 'Campus']|uniref:hypothetical protein n=1 Tax=Gordonia sp. 'Campus' TaxID=2915824 RepID=UPI001EE43AD8|nr:hypothetical protein [Gordonia sp. 'Campus']
MRSLHGRPGPALAAAVLVVAVAAGCGTGAPAGQRPSEGATTSTEVNVYERDRAEGVTRLLDALTEAVSSGDVRSIGTLLDVSATPVFKDRFVTAAANLRAPTFPSRSGRDGPLRFGRFRYQLAPTEEAEVLVPPDLQQLLDAGGSSDSWVVPVELRYALGGQRAPGIAESEIVVGTQFVVARHGDDWRLVADAEALGGDPAPTQMWEIPGLTAADVGTAGGTSVVAHYPDTSTTVAALRRLLPDAVDSVTAFWGEGWDRRAVVVPTATDEQFAALVPGGRAAIGTAAAATVFNHLDRAQRSVTGQRIVLTRAARELAEPTLAVVLRHELTHVAARADTAVDAPLWITEGVAEYVGRKGTYTRLADAAPDLAEAVRAGAGPTAPPADADFAMDGQTSQVAYQSAWSLAAYVADRFDEARLKKMYIGVAASALPAAQDAAITAALGVSRDQLLAGWQRWLAGQIR